MSTPSVTSNAQPRIPKGEITKLKTITNDIYLLDPIHAGTHVKNTSESSPPPQPISINFSPSKGLAELGSLLEKRKEKVNPTEKDRRKPKVFTRNAPEVPA